MSVVTSSTSSPISTPWILSVRSERRVLRHNRLFSSRPVMSLRCISCVAKLLNNYVGWSIKKKHPQSCRIAMCCLVLMRTVLIQKIINGSSERNQTACYGATRNKPTMTKAWHLRVKACRRCSGIVLRHYLIDMQSLVALG